MFFEPSAVCRTCDLGFEFRVMVDHDLTIGGEVDVHFGGVHTEGERPRERREGVLRRKTRAPPMPDDI
jgi:hypothetical protein